MKFSIKTNKGIVDVTRTIGYHAKYLQKGEEVSVVRKLSGGDYPRFHLYIKPSFVSSFAKASKDRKASEGQMQVKEGDYIFSLHLDQKKPSYEGSKKHSGEYDGNVVESEAERIKDLLK